jgi:sulfite reductase (ferredoxin)
LAVRLSLISFGWGLRLTKRGFQEHTWIGCTSTSWKSELEPIFVFFSSRDKLRRSFGDFCDRVGFDAIRQFTVDYESEAVSPQSDAGLINEVVLPEESEIQVAAKIRRRINVRDEVYTRLKAEAARQGKPVTQLASDAIEAYLQANQASPE